MFPGGEAVDDAACDQSVVCSRIKSAQSLPAICQCLSFGWYDWFSVRHTRGRYAHCPSFGSQQMPEENLLELSHTRRLAIAMPECHDAIFKEYTLAELIQS